MMKLERGSLAGREGAGGVCRPPRKGRFALPVAPEPVLEAILLIDEGGYQIGCRLYFIPIPGTK